MPRREDDDTRPREARPAPVRRATYYLRPDQIRGIKVFAAARERQVSAMMREAVDLYLDTRAPDVLRRLRHRWVPRLRV